MRYITAQQMREIDRRAIQEFGIPGVVLMENAGRSVFEELMNQIDDRSKVIIFCGKGNNGGDGYVLARHLINHGIKVKVFILAAKEDIKGDAKTNLDILLKMKADINEVNNPEDLEKAIQEVASSDIIVDGILGTGVKGEIVGLPRQAIELLNKVNKPVIAIDIPSGLDADTGKVLGVCLKAKKTVTFGLPKKGFKNPEVKDFLGELIVADIGIPRELLE